MGSYYTQGIERIYQRAGGQVWEIIRKMTALRLSEKLPVLVDATFINDEARAEFVKLAKTYGYETVILIFDRSLEVCLQNNDRRGARAPEKVIQEFDAKFERESQFPFRYVPINSVPRWKVNQLSTKNIDVIGDIHGLYDEFLLLLDKLGYKLIDNVPHHPKGRKLLFLGDIVDRGPKSIEMLKLAYNAVNAGHFMVIGNHERNLIQYWESLQEGVPNVRSLSSAQTAMALSRLSTVDAGKLIEFLKSLPTYYVFEEGANQVAFVHANLSQFDPMKTICSDCIYGSEELSRGSDSDKIYSERYAANDNKYLLIRGHIEATGTESSACFSLEMKQAYGGDLAALRLDQFVDGLSQQSASKSFESSVVTQRSTFNFDNEQGKFELIRKLNVLVKEKLVTRKVDAKSGLALYKYGKKVFYNNLWGESDAFLKARGIVLNPAGEIVAHPFDKIFNYLENGTGREIADDYPVQAIDKLNGFLGCISKHPFKEDILITTSGSFDSDFVEYIKDFLTPALKSSLFRFFYAHKCTLMFEVIHPKDPHIIQYAEKDQGLWLIGARGLRVDAELFTEAHLDEIAEDLQVRRPSWKKTTFGEIKRENKKSKLEGFIIRDEKTQKPLLKLKTPYYLTTKFVARKTEDKIKFMFNNPSKFKESLDEEFYEVVDELLSKTTLESYIQLEEAERVKLIQSIIEKIQTPLLGLASED